VTAGELRVGEQVVRLDGGTATVAVIHVHPGAADYYNLTVSHLHTYAVGTGQYVVHNCGDQELLTDGTKVNISQTTEGFQHSLKHAIREWLGRGPAGQATITQTEKDTWQTAIRRTAQASRKIFPWDSKGTPTKAVLGRFVGRPFVIQFRQEWASVVSGQLKTRQTTLSM
jgi:hypothetical protein